VCVVYMFNILILIFFLNIILILFLGRGAAVSASFCLAVWLFSVFTCNR